MGHNKDFYTSMSYPIPKENKQYTYISEIQWLTQSQTDHNHVVNDNFSRSEKNPFMDEYIEYINKLWRLYKSIPCIRQIYLCNSITFNALHDNSDIDLCIITRSWYLRFARLFSRLYISLLKAKRSKGKYGINKKRFCLTFYIDEKHANIYGLRKKQGDIYLSYRLAHSVLLYTDNTLSDNYLIEQNRELLEYLPYHPPYQSISIWNSIFKGNNYFKYSSEFLLCNPIGRIIQYCIQYIRGKIILRYKISKLSPATRKEIIISPYMLKFHQDKRNIIQHKREVS